MDEYQKLYCEIYGVSIEDLAYLAGFFDGEGSVIARVCKTNKSFT